MYSQLSPEQVTSQQIAERVKYKAVASYQDLTVIEGSARLGTTMKTFSVRSATFRSCTATIALLFSLSFQAKAIRLDFANLPETVINFSGGSFAFTSNTNGYQFTINSVEGGSGDSINDRGYLLPGGPFNIGTITTVGGLQQAPVSGTAILHITDASSIDLIGTITWNDITTIANTAGDLDLSGTINLNAITYPGTGTSSDLSALAAAGAATDIVSFQFSPGGGSLASLATAGGQTSYSGSITAVPEPGTWVLVAMGTGLGVFFRGRKQVRLERIN